MKLKKGIYRSAESEDASCRARFRNQGFIQSSLAKICDAWFEYLQDYALESKSIFRNKRQNAPWEINERATVSTLSAAISRSFAKSFVIEERVVRKRATESGAGRCDLWSSICGLGEPGTRFNFYLEAKKSKLTGNITIAQIPEHLSGFYGMGKLFSDLAKGKKGKITHTSPYAGGAADEHLYIGMLITLLKPGKTEVEEIERKLDKVFGAGESRATREIVFKRKGIARRQTTKRKLFRLPTTALIVVPEDGRHQGMIASFVVLGATSGLRAKSDKEAQ